MGGGRVGGGCSGNRIRLLLGREHGGLGSLAELQLLELCRQLVLSLQHADAACLALSTRSRNDANLDPGQV